MTARRCAHCGQLLGSKDAGHDCWTTTEAALTRHLPDELREAWERLRETAAAFGGQRIYASHHSIMFSRSACYFFVRPRSKALEICVFLGRTVTAPQVRRAVSVSRVKVSHTIIVRHRDEVEAPITDWLREAYDVAETLRAAASGPSRTPASDRRAPRASPAAFAPRTRTRGAPAPRARARSSSVRSPVARPRIRKHR